MNSVEDAIRRDAPPSRRPNGWPAVLVFFLAFVAVGAAQAVTIGIGSIRTGSPIPGGRLLAATLAGAVVLALASVAAAFLLRMDDLVASLSLGPTRASATGYVAAVVGTLALSVGCATTTSLLGLRSSVMGEIEHALRNPPGGVAVGLAAVAIGPGLAEEMFFRGFLLTRWVATWGRWTGIVTSSAAFGAMHVDPVQGTNAFLLGLFLGWTASRLGGIRVTMVAHMANNAAFAMVSGPDAADSRGVDATVIAVAAAVWAGSTYVLRSRAALRALES